MKSSILIIIILFLSFDAFSQIPQGRYFDDIEGANWTTSIDLNNEKITDLNKIALTIIETDLDSIKSNITIWSFDQTLKIESYNLSSKERTLILNCKYKQDRNNKILKLYVENMELEFSYVFSSNGAFTMLTKKKT